MGTGYGWITWRLYMLEKKVQLDTHHRLYQLTRSKTLRQATSILAVQPLIRQGCTVRSTGLMYRGNMLYTDYILGLTPSIETCTSVFILQMDHWTRRNL